MDYRVLKSIALLLILIQLQIPTTLYTTPSPSNNNIVYVPGDYPDLQTAVDNAEPGTVIIVYSGVYSASIVGKTNISIIGVEEGSNTTNGVYITSLFIDNSTFISIDRVRISSSLGIYCSNNISLNNILVSKTSPNREQDRIVISIGSSKNIVLDNITEKYLPLYGIGITIDNVDNIILNKVVLKYPISRIELRNSANIHIYNSSITVDMPECILDRSRNIFIEDSVFANLEFFSIQDLTINNCTIEYIYIGGSSSTSINDSVIFNIDVCSSTEIAITNNVFNPYFHRGRAFSISHSHNIVLINNSFYGCSPIIVGDEETYNTLILINNTVNKKPLLYISNRVYDGVYLTDLYSGYDSVIVYNVSGLIINGLKTNVSNAVIVLYSRNIIIVDNIFNYTEDPVSIYSSKNISIVNNTFMYSTLRGFTRSVYIIANKFYNSYIDLFSISVFQNNVLINSSMYLRHADNVSNNIFYNTRVTITGSVNVFANNALYGLGIVLEHMDHYPLFAVKYFYNNTVNGKPIVYLRNYSGSWIEYSGVGQVILDRVRNVRVSDSVFNTSPFGVYIIDSKNIVLWNCSIYRGSYGVFVFGSRNIEIKLCNIGFNDYGVYVVSSSNVSVVYNIIHDNTIGIFINVGYDDRGIYIYGNSFINNSYKDLQVVSIIRGDPFYTLRPRIWIYSPRMIYYVFNNSVKYFFIGNYWDRHNCSSLFGDYGVCTPAHVIYEWLPDKVPLAYPSTNYVFIGRVYPVLNVSLLNNSVNGWYNGSILLRVYTKGITPVSIGLKCVDGNYSKTIINKTIDKEILIPINTTLLSDGIYILNTTILLGRDSVSEIVYLKIDNNPPYLEVIKPVNDSVVDDSLELFIIYYDKFIDKVYAEVYGVDSHYLIDLLNRGRLEINTSKWREGLYKIVFTAIDKIGYKVTKTIYVRVEHRRETIIYNITYISETSSKTTTTSYALLLITLIAVIAIATVYRVYRKNR